LDQSSDGGGHDLESVNKAKDPHGNCWTHLRDLSSQPTETRLSHGAKTHVSREGSSFARRKENATPMQVLANMGANGELKAARIPWSWVARDGGSNKLRPCRPTAATVRRGGPKLIPAMHMSNVFQQTALSEARTASQVVSMTLIDRSSKDMPSLEGSPSNSMPAGSGRRKSERKSGRSRRNHVHTELRRC
jgi:hypothetical protein